MKLANFGLVAAVIAALVPAACGVTLDAPDITLLVQDGGILYAAPQDEENLVGGETVLIIRNDSPAYRQIVLAKVDAASPDELPRQLVNARIARDDDRILAMTNRLEPKEATFAGGGLGYVIDQASFHVHLRPGESYVLFDRLRGGLRQGVFVQLIPGEQSA